MQSCYLEYMETVTQNDPLQEHLKTQFIHSSSFTRHFWQGLLAWSLILVWASIFCVFLEGKSSYDLAFTLWDDEYAKVPLDSMGNIILPQFVVGTVFLVISALLVAMFVNSRYFKQFTAVIVLATGILLVAFVISFGNIGINYMGGRQGPTGWTIIEFPWLSLLLFCTSNASGMIGAWFLVSQEIPRITTPSIKRMTLTKGLQVLASWIARILLIIAILLGSLALCAGAILVFNHVNAAFVIAAIGCAVAMGLSFFKNDVFQTDFKKKKQAGKKQVWLFTPDPITHQDGTELNRMFDFVVNPRNIAWRSIRNLFNGILTAMCIFLITALCFATVPDEWVFNRFFDLLPWMILGVLIGTGAMAIIPEPSFFYPAFFIYFMQAYSKFLTNFDIPFDPGYIALNGGLFGFWIAVFISSQFYMYRAKTRGRNFNLMVFLMITFSLTWMILCFADRFQHDGQMVQAPVTSVIGVLVPIFLTVAQYFLYVSVGFWGLDIAYRVYRKYKPPEPPRQAISGPARAPRLAKLHLPKLAMQLNITNQRKKIIALLVLGVFIGSFSVVQVAHVYGSEIRPLLYRGDDFGIWTVDAVTKVEKDFPIQMPGFAPIESNINVAAARGEWNGFHVLISPQPGKTVILTNVTWNPFLLESSSKTLNTSIMQVFLVSYLIDQQPDQLVELPASVTSTGEEHVDLYFQLLVPGNATAGNYDATINLTINARDNPVPLRLHVYNFTIPANNHLQTAFGGGWNTNQWYDELQYLRISQQDMGIPFGYGSQYWWNSTAHAFQFNWTAYDSAFQAQLARNFTGFSQGYFPVRPTEITNDSEWAIIQAHFLHDVSAHLESKTWLDQTGTNHSWVELPYIYWTDEPPMTQYQHIKEVDDLYHANGTSKLRAILTLGFDTNYDILNKSVDILCPVIGNFEPMAVIKAHVAGQKYWFYTDVDPIAPYPNFQLQEPGNDPRLLPYICARFNADGFLYWSLNAGNFTYRAGFDGNGDGQLAFNDSRTGRLLPSLRLLSFSLGVEDYECIWLMRATVQDKTINGTIPGALLSRAAAMETRLNDLVGARPWYVNHDPNTLTSFKSDLSQLLEDLWPYSKKLYS